MTTFENARAGGELRADLDYPTMAEIARSRSSSDRWSRPERLAGVDFEALADRLLADLTT